MPIIFPPPPCPFDWQIVAGRRKQASSPGRMKIARNGPANRADTSTGDPRTRHLRRAQWRACFARLRQGSQFALKTRRGVVAPNPHFRPLPPAGGFWLPPSPRGTFQIARKGTANRTEAPSGYPRTGHHRRTQWRPCFAQLRGIAQIPFLPSVSVSAENRCIRPPPSTPGTFARNAA